MCGVINLVEDEKEGKTTREREIYKKVPLGKINFPQTLNRWETFFGKKRKDFFCAPRRTKKRNGHTKKKKKKKNERAENRRQQHQQKKKKKKKKKKMADTPRAGERKEDDRGSAAEVR